MPDPNEPLREKLCNALGIFPEEIEHSLSVNIGENVIKRLEKLIADDKSALLEQVDMPDEYEYEGFHGCSNINPDYCACETYEDPICYYCEQDIEVGQLIMSVARTEDPFSKDDGYEYLYAHKECPLNNLKEEVKEL